MKKSMLLAVMLICMLVFVSLPALALSSTLDQSYDPGYFDSGGFLSYGTSLAAQTFTAGVTGTLTGVELAISHYETPLYSMRVAIQPMAGGVPASTELAYAVVLPGDLKPDMFETFITLSSGVEVTAGTEYAIVVSTDAPLTIGQGTWHGNYPGGYPDGKVCYYAGYWACNDSDFGFRTYVTVDTSSNAAPTVYDVTVETDEDVSVDIAPYLSAEDPDGDPLSYVVVDGSGPWYGVLDSNFIYTPNPNESGEDGFAYQAYDGELYSNVAIVIINISPVNDAPVVDSIVAPTDPVPVNTTFSAGARFTDVDVGYAPGDSHVAVWDWGDGSTSDGILGGGPGGITGSHAYAEAGIYTVTLTVTDDAGAYDTADFQYIVVYDPDGGFVTGGGWIDSPAGAYKADESLTGKASFAFVSKYKRRASVPTGNTTFEFKAGGLEFASDTYDWLVVNRIGTYARFKGRGSVNGEDGYRFMIWAGDSEPDTFRIRIWTEDAAGIETDVYDNGSDQAIGGGNIVVHKSR